MFKPTYKLTSEILKNIGIIERLYGQLEGMQIPASLLLNLKRDNLVQSAYSSNSIEGNPLTHIEVTNLILGGIIPTNRDEREVKNYFDILQTLDKKVSDKFNLEEILAIHMHLMTGVNNEIAGKVRSNEVIIGYKDVISGNLVVKHNPPFHDENKIKSALKELFTWASNSNEMAMITAGIYHHQFVYLHPFTDGNGRVCRLTTALLLLKSKYQINKYFVLDDYYDIDRDQYSDKLHSADQGDKTEWLEYFTEGVKYSLQSALAKIEKGLSRSTIDVRPTTRETDVLNLMQQFREMKTSDLAKELSLSRQQAFNLLRNLVEKGYLESVGKRKNRYYVLK
ncbi:MAG: Fic family protein [bacterium]